MITITDQNGAIIALEAHGTRYSPAQLLIAAGIVERWTPVVQAAAAFVRAWEATEAAMQRDGADPADIARLINEQDERIGQLRTAVVLAGLMEQTDA